MKKLSNIVDNKKTLMDSIIESVTCFSKLVKLRISENNDFGTNVLDVLVLEYLLDEIVNNIYLEMS